MNRSEFRIGLEFWSSDRRWRCTDVGTRVAIAIRVDEVTVAHSTGEQEVLTGAEAAAAGWLDGPPDAVAEFVFDEYDMEGCSLEPDD